MSQLFAVSIFTLLLILLPLKLSGALPSPVTRPPIVMYRILGNNVPFVQGCEQNVKNLQYILERESSFPNVTKRFVINHVVNATQLRVLRQLLKRAGYTGDAVTVLPFRTSVYRRLQVLGVGGEPGERRFWNDCSR
eukprot:NODE_3901_length_897_cov_6.610849_g3591_i0.p1 GENE.NODE_3901_length_897_cov_6.610849_g3591_i0~~NODE_3901_length_897_cov_6.610849_g3591_i0.p1  ORF type:complete len:151 (-),score=33.16 NODE_3901_length_897_cov_6.610849_g3591_i0:443-850(-)